MDCRDATVCLQFVLQFLLTLVEFSYCWRPLETFLLLSIFLFVIHSRIFLHDLAGRRARLDAARPCMHRGTSLAALKCSECVLYV